MVSFVHRPLVAAVALGAVEHTVSGLQPRAQTCGRGVRARQTEADGGLQARRAVQAQRFHAFADASCDLLGGDQIAAAQEHGELVATQAPGAVQGADAVADHAGDRAQHVVARGMPVAVVDGLEVIDVDHLQRGRFAGFGALREQQRRLVLPVAATVQAGEGVATAEFV